MEQPIQKALSTRWKNQITVYITQKATTVHVHIEMHNRDTLIEQSP